MKKQIITSASKVREQHTDNDDDFDRMSHNSEISINTDLKVFNGAIGKIAKLNRAYEDIKNSTNMLSKNNTINIKDKKKRENITLDMKMKNSPTFNVKLEDNGLNIKTDLTDEEISQSYRRPGSPLSFRPKLVEEIEKVNINKDEVVQIKEEESGSDSENDDKASKNSNNSKKSNHDIDINYPYRRKKADKGKSSPEKNNLTNISNNSNHSNKEKKQKDIEIIRNMMAICNDTEADTDINDPLQDTDKNVFWNLRENSDINCEVEYSNSKRSNRNSFVNTNFSNSGRLNSFNNKFNYKTATNSQIACTISKIEKGVAILVSSDDNIFTLPISFLPKNILPGNSYQITIDETCNIQKKISTFQHMQKRFIKK